MAKETKSKIEKLVKNARSAVDRLDPFRFKSFEYKNLGTKHPTREGKTGYEVYLEEWAYKGNCKPIKDLLDYLEEKVNKHETSFETTTSYIRDEWYDRGTPVDVSRINLKIYPYIFDWVYGELTVYYHHSRHPSNEELRIENKLFSIDPIDFPKQSEQIRKFSKIFINFH